MTQADLLEWYLGERDDIDSEEELALARRKVCSIIQRLVQIDHVLVVLNDMEIAEIKPLSKQRDARKLAVHPNVPTDDA